MNPYGSHHHPVKRWMGHWSGGVVLVSQTLCLVYAPCRKMLEWLLATDEVWLEGKSWQLRQTGVFSCRACQFVKWRRSPQHFFLFFKHRCIGVRCQCESSLFLSPRLLTAEKSKLPFYLTLPQPPLELRGCVCVCADMLSPSVFLCHIKLVRGWERRYWSLASWIFSVSDCRVLICILLLI